MQPKRGQKRLLLDHGRRPHPRFLRSRLRFCPAARMSASQLTRQSRRKRKRRIPCQSLPSANNGSTHTLRLRIRFLVGFRLLVASDPIQHFFIDTATEAASLFAGRTLGFERTVIAVPGA